MPVTYPNQRMIHIHRERATSDFLGIKNNNWQAAARDLGAHALMLYLYFAANADNYMLALSPVAIRQAVGMPSSTYRDQFMKLIDKGYLVQRGDSNSFDFYEIPQRVSYTENDDTLDDDSFTPNDMETPQTVIDNTGDNREINNIYNKNMINNCSGEKQVSPSLSSKFYF